MISIFLGLPKKRINIKIVGCGFEARDTSEFQHEEYTILQKDFAKLKEVMCFSDQPFVKQKVISIRDYRASAKKRLDFLVDACGFDVNDVLDNLPMYEYTKIGKGTEEKILKTFINDMTEDLIIYGEIIGGNIKTWRHSYNTPITYYSYR